MREDNLTPDEKQELERILSKLDAEGIAHLRKSQGLSQERLALSLGVSVRSVWRWEHEKGKPINVIRQEIGKIYGDILLNDSYYDEYRI